EVFAWPQNAVIGPGWPVSAASPAAAPETHQKAERGAHLSMRAPFLSTPQCADPAMLLLLLAADHRYEADEARSEKSHRAWLWGRNETLNRRVAVVVVRRDDRVTQAWREVRQGIGRCIDVEDRRVGRIPVGKASGAGDRTREGAEKASLACGRGRLEHVQGELIIERPVRTCRSSGGQEVAEADVARRRRRRARQAVERDGHPTVTDRVRARGRKYARRKVRHLSLRGRWKCQRCRSTSDSG